MLYRRSAQVALQAAILLASEADQGARRVRELAEALDVPATYLTKVLQALTRAGLLTAVRGPGGGVQLSRSPREVSLFDVLSAVEPVGEFERCCLGMGQCNNAKPCAFHHVWGPARDRMLDFLKSQSLWEFAANARRNGRLTFHREDPDGALPVNTKLANWEGAQS